LAAAHYIENLEQGIRIINIDESIINMLDRRIKSWSRKSKPLHVKIEEPLAQVNIIAGISNRGEFYFTLNKGINNSMTFYYFILKLVTHLDNVDWNWRSWTVLLIDNAPYHRSNALLEKFNEL
jgi:hypothetical protein